MVNGRPGGLVVSSLTMFRVQAREGLKDRKIEAQVEKENFHQFKS
jgi:hypothetical protein